MVHTIITITFAAKQSIQQAMKEPDFDLQMLSRNGEEVSQYSGKKGFMVDIYSGSKKMNGLHTHTYYFMLWIKRGIGTHYINFENIPIEGNQIFFIAPGELHKVHYKNEDFDDIAIPFTEDLLNLLPPNVSNWIRFELFNNIDKSIVATIDAKTERILNKWVEDINSLTYERNDDTYYCLAALLSVILLYLKGHASWNSEFKDHNLNKLHIFYGFRKLIEDNLRDMHSPAQYAIELGIAEYKLAAITKEIYGASPKKLINKEILLRAKRLLAENDLIVKEIAEKLGFKDAPHFVNFIKKETGMTPKQFKDCL